MLYKNHHKNVSSIDDDIPSDSNQSIVTQNITIGITNNNDDIDDWLWKLKC